MTDLAIITPSYRGDFDLAVDLCRSVDRHVKGSYEHVLVVPKRDLSRFKTLEGPRRRILTQEEVLKAAGIYRLPLPNRLHVPPFINLRLGEQWVGPGGRRVIGWIVQQLIKLSSPQISSAELLVFADSDIILFRDISAQSFMSDGAVYLHEHTRGLDRASHKKWLEIAEKLLGLEGHENSEPLNYIGMLVAWRRENVLLLQQALVKHGEGRWQDAIVKMGDVSEYILYGVFCRKILGPSSQHAYRDVNNSLSIWLSPAGDLEEEALKQLADTHVCLHIQSVLGVSLQTRHKILESVYAALGGSEIAAVERIGV